MCSIAGWTSERPIHLESAHRLTRALLFYGEARGSQSAGLYMNSTIIKRAMQPSAFIKSKAVKKFWESLKFSPTQALFHTRQPTMGGMGDAQAQPFRTGHVVTVHNGMIANTAALREEFKLDKPSGVDSELFSEFIHNHGIRNLPKLIESLQGSASIVASLGTNLIAYRTSNPLHYTTIKLDNKNLITIFASTREQLQAALRHTWLLHDRDMSISMSTEHRFYDVKPDGFSQANDISDKFCMPKSMYSYQNRSHTNDHRTGDSYRGNTRGRYVQGKWEPYNSETVSSPKALPAPTTTTTSSAAGKTTTPESDILADHFNKGTMPPDELLRQLALDLDQPMNEVRMWFLNPPARSEEAKHTAAYKNPITPDITGSHKHKKGGNETPVHPFHSVSGIRHPIPNFGPVHTPTPTPDAPEPTTETTTPATAP